jgi:CelD/BcsL family acetyltransferase involved in cellulose biosynthesis
MYTVDIIEQQQGMKDYAQPWRSLFDSGSYELSTSYEWTQALLATHLQKNDVVAIAVIKNEKAVAGIIPLLIRTVKKCGASLTYVLPVGELYNTHSDLLLNGTHEELMAVFVSSLFKLNCPWDIFKVNRFAETNQFLGPLEQYLKKSSIKFDAVMEEPSFYIPLDGSFDEYLKGRTAHFRRDVKTKTKKMAGMGLMEITSHNQYQDVCDAYGALLSIEQKSWKYGHGTSIAQVQKQAKFYLNLCESAQKQGWLHLSFLRLDQNPIAYNLGLIRNKTYYYKKTSFDGRYKEASPSTVLRAKLVEDLIKSGVREIDFSDEPYAWQRRWTDSFRWHKSVVIYNKTIKAAFYSVYNRVRQRIRPWDKNNVVFRNPKAFVADIG